MAVPYEMQQRLTEKINREHGGLNALLSDLRRGSGIFGSLGNKKLGRAVGAALPGAIASRDRGFGDNDASKFIAKVQAGTQERTRGMAEEGATKRTETTQEGATYRQQLAIAGNKALQGMRSDTALKMQSNQHDEDYRAQRTLLNSSADERTALLDFYNTTSNRKRRPYEFQGDSDPIANVLNQQEEDDQTYLMFE